MEGVNSIMLVCGDDHHAKHIIFKGSYDIKPCSVRHLYVKEYKVGAQCLYRLNA